ncbi:MAG TPA: ABC transporter permease [Phototrophicaceae bacterium]|nr:ABC transporter permease [Phototrophicaceae bacterium]
MTHFLSTAFDQTINGLVIGNIYALIAVGLAIIFGVGNLINFAHGSVYMIGAYVGWVCVTMLHLPLPITFGVVALVCGVVGLLIERIGLRRLQNAPRIAPLLATIGISFVLDELTQIIFSHDPQSFPNPLPPTRIHIGGVTIGYVDILIAVIGIGSALLLFLFLRYTKLGWALRATAQDREAAQQMGVDVNRVNQTAFALAAILGGIAGVLVGIYFQTVYPTMSTDAVLKGFTANLIGGLGSIPGAVAGGLVLGLIESYGVAIFGSTYRDLFAYAILLLMLILRPNGLFSRKRQLPPEPLTGTFIPNKRGIRLPYWVVIVGAAALLIFPLIISDPYILQVLTNAWLFGLIALSITLVTGTAGQTSLGQAGFVAIGAYACALLTLRLNWPFVPALIAAGIITGILGTLLVLPAFRLRAHYVAIATLAVGEIITQIILNWKSLTKGSLGLVSIPPPEIFGIDMIYPRDVYWFSLALLLIAALLQWRLIRSSLGRIWRALRDDEVAAQAYGIGLNRYKALAFASSAFIAGISGAFTANMYTYINYQTFPDSLSVLTLTMAILGGMGNIVGAVLGALALTILPELLRGSADYRYFFYGLVLLLLVQFRPQGILGID